MSVNGCGRPAQCPPAEEQWSVSASVLKVIWADIMPRVMARGWRIGTPDFLLPFGPVSNADLQAAMDVLETEAFDTTALGVGVTPFQRRLDLVRKYLDESDKPIPINFIGQAGFDFVLSDAGLDLFTPPQPSTARDILRYYSFRRTGRATLGIPDYLDGAKDLAFDVQAPTGPGQILTTPAGMSASVSADGCTLDRLDCFEFEDLRSTSKALPSDEKASSAQNPEDHGAAAPGRDDDRAPERAWTHRFSYRNYYCAADRVRCWQVEGAVYRAIVVELPRVIAEIWLEREAAIHGRHGSYNRRFGPAFPPPLDPKEDPDPRSIFMERLETSLPDAAHMAFDVVQGLDDVIITNQGFKLPAASVVPNLPTRDALLEAIADGHAGNPVFTDSRRPDRPV